MCVRVIVCVVVCDCVFVCMLVCACAYACLSVCVCLCVCDCVCACVCVRVMNLYTNPCMHAVPLATVLTFADAVCLLTMSFVHTHPHHFPSIASIMNS